MDQKVIANNKKAYYEYFILDKFEAGIELTGSEVKSLREGKASLKEGYVVIRDKEAIMMGVHISPYSHTGYQGHDPKRDRRLLLTKRELVKLHQKTTEKGMTIIPLKLYFTKNWAKVEIGLAKGKKHYDKKATLKEKDIKRETAREMRKYK